MWGRKRLDLTIDRVTGFCQNQDFNHDFMLSIMELLLSKLVNVVDKKNITSE